MATAQPCALAALKHLPAGPDEVASTVARLIVRTCGEWEWVDENGNVVADPNVHPKRTAVNLLAADTPADLPGSAHSAGGEWPAGGGRESSDGRGSASEEVLSQLSAIAESLQKLEVRAESPVLARTGGPSLSPRLTDERQVFDCLACWARQLLA